MAATDSTVVRKLHALERRLAAIERGQRYAHGGSIEDAALEVRDDAGSLRAVVGQLGDGTTGVNVVNGPVPPTPSAPTVEPALAALAVTWDGTFADAVASPLDWMRVEVHIGPDADYEPSQGTLRDTIESPQGGTVTVPLPYTEWFVKLRSRTTSGVASESTAAVAGTPRQAEAADITAGSIIAEHIAVDAITGKNITGGTITGSLIQTAETGERITINEGGTNKILLYDSSGTAVGELADRGLLVQGDSGAIIYLDPEHSYPNIRLTNSTRTDWATINVVEAGGVPCLGLNSGLFTGSGHTDMKWRTFFGNDFYIIDRIHGSLSTNAIGGRIEMFYNSASIGYTDSSGATTAADLYITPGKIKARGVFSANNMAFGNIVVTPIANTPTPISVSGVNLSGTTFYGYATANTTVPGSSVQEVSVSSASATGMTVWVYRTNATNTTVNWQIIGV